MRRQNDKVRVSLLLEPSVVQLLRDRAPHKRAQSAFVAGLLREHVQQSTFSVENQIDDRLRRIEAMLARVCVH